MTMSRVAVRSKQLARLHVAAHAAGFKTVPGKPGREDYEAELQKLAGRTSSRQARRFEREAIIEHFENYDARTPAPEMTQEEADALEAECLALLEVA